ncbi:MAG: hypothetical protein JWN78_2035 [Bacteroidota bacterium]|nr:hypothetical protein [Bacteroidota bacterium]
MKYRILTISGIVLLFGYFIMDSFKNSSSLEDPNRVVLVGGDTLGRDWGAQADERERVKKQQAEGTAADDDGSNTASVNAGTPAGNKSSTNQFSSDNLTQGQDPYEKQKLNSSDYSTVMDGNGREVITGYNPEENDNQNFETRHQREAGRNEPTIKYKE